MKETQRQIKAQNEEIHYIKSKIYQLITTNKNLRKELDNAQTPKQKPKVPLKNNTPPLTKNNKMATKYNKTRGAQRQIKAQIEEISYLKSKIYQLITTLKNLKKELDNAYQENQGNQEKWRKVENRKRRNKTNRHAKKHSHTDCDSSPKMNHQPNQNNNSRHNCH